MVEKIKKNLPLMAFVLGVFAVLMVFCPWVAGKEESSAGINGLKVVFGDEDSGIAFSFLALITLACPIVGVVLTYMADSKNDNKLQLIAGICFAAGALCFALSVVFLTFDTKELEDWMGKSEVKDYIKEMKEELTLGSGAWIGLVCSAAAACCQLIPAVKAMPKKVPMQPMMYGQPQQPMMYGQPAPQQPMYGQPQQPVQPAPQQPMYGQPQQPVQPVAPQQPMYGQPQQPVQPMPQYPQYPQNGQNRPQ